MSFSSPGFLFAFMPVFFILYYLTPLFLRNYILFISSLAFYTIDGGYISIVLIGSVVVNQLAGATINHNKSHFYNKTILFISILINIMPLIYYKYWNFFSAITSDACTALGKQCGLFSADIALPAGISFFTFQGISYIVDIYRREITPAPSVVDFGMYHTLFPQLIAGPIVRYAEVEHSIINRPSPVSEIDKGIVIFCIGLGKKILIADAMGTIADRMFSLPVEQMSTSAAWMGALSYTLQIYFDFSGYSDMAIGLGRMLGFRFPQNFAQPYRAGSITDFWRRWHMTLSRWFRDYVYIPLGGNRGGSVRTFANLVIVFFLCGLWHGAAYTFIVWGLYHGGLLVIERAMNVTRDTRLNPLRWLITMLLVIVGWVIFRAASLAEANRILFAMFGAGRATTPFDLAAFVTPDMIVFFLIGALISLFPFERVPRLDLKFVDGDYGPGWGRRLAAVGLLGYSVVMIAANGFNPFIYFRF